MKRLSLLISGVVAFCVVIGCTQQEEEGADAKIEELAEKPGDDVFAFNNGAEPESLDPHRITSHDAAQLTNQMFEGLLARERDHVGIAPGVAEEWNVSEDGKTYTFKIREGLKWSNGDELTVEQIRDSFLRALNPALGNLYVYWYNDFIEGAREYHKDYDNEELREQVGIEVVGENELEIRLMEPAVHFVYFLSQPTYAIVHPSMHDHNSEAWQEPDQYIVNGPYKLSEWRVNQRIKMEKNPNYRRADDVEISTIISYPIVDKMTTLNMYRSDQLDWTGENTIPSSLVPSLREEDDFHIINAFGTYKFLFNLEKEVLQDKRVRQALSMVVQRKQITDRVLRGGQIPTQRLIPPGVKGYESLVKEDRSYEERVEKAQELLAEAGYPEGEGFPRINVLYNTDEGHQQVAQALQQMWRRQLGINVSLENQEWKVFLQEQEAGNFEISRQGWIGDYPEPLTFLEIFMTESENNKTGWSNEEYDQLVEQGMSIQDREKRFELYAKAEEILVEEAPMFPIYHYTYFSLMSPDVEGFEPNIFGHYQFQYLSKN